MPRSCTAEGCVVNTAGVLCYKHRTHCNTCKERLGGGSKSSKGKCNHCRRGGLCKHPSGCAKRYGNTTGGRKSKLCAGHRRQSSKDDASHADTVVQAPDAGGNGPRTQCLSAAESHRIYLRDDILNASIESPVVEKTCLLCRTMGRHVHGRWQLITRSAWWDVGGGCSGR